MKPAKPAGEPKARNPYEGRKLDSRLLFTMDDAALERLQQPVEVVTIPEPGTDAEPTRETKTFEAQVTKNEKPLSDPDCPLVVLGMPHSGLDVPAKLYDAMTPEGREQLPLIDDATDEIGQVDEMPWVRGAWSRYVVDLNRMALGPNPENSNEEDRELEVGSSSMTWLKAAFVEGASAFQEGSEPTPEQVQDLAKITYVPYYREAMGMVGSLLDRRERGEDGKTGQRVLFLDVHSFPVGEKWDKYAPAWIQEDSFENLAVFNLGYKNDFGLISSDPDITAAFNQALIDEFRQLPAQQQEALTGKPVAEIDDNDISRTEHLLQGMQNVEFWGDLGSQQEILAAALAAKKADDMATHDRLLEEANQALSEFRKQSGMNALQVELKETYKDYGATESGGKDYDNASINHDLTAALQGVMKRALLRVDKEVLKKTD